MNKLHLFIFSLFSITVFSCSAMDKLSIKTAHAAKSNLYKLYEFTYQKLNQSNPKPESDEQVFRIHLQSFNDSALLLKKDRGKDQIITGMNNDSIRLTMVDHLTYLEKEITFLVSAGQPKNQNAIKKSLRLTYIEDAKQQLDINSQLTIPQLEELEQIINKIADFSVDKNLQTDISESTVLFSSINTYGLNEEVQALLKEKQELDAEKENQRKQAAALKILQEKIEQEKKEQEKISKEKEELGKKDQEEKELKLEQERLAKLEAEKVELEKKEQEKLEQERIAKEKEELEKQREKAIQLANQIQKNKELKEQTEQQQIQLDQLKKENKEKLERERVEKDRLEKLEQEKLEQQQIKKEELSKKQTPSFISQYKWYLGGGFLVTAALVYYLNLHTKLTPYLSYS